jgi:hypothetical protein
MADTDTKTKDAAAADEWAAALEAEEKQKAAAAAAPAVGAAVDGKDGQPQRVLNQDEIDLMPRRAPLPARARRVFSPSSTNR